MPYLKGPEQRHYGRAERTIERNGKRITIGLVYDPGGVPPLQIEREFTEELQNFLSTLGTLTRSRADWERLERIGAWEVVARLIARYPGDVLPHPGIPCPLEPDSPEGWWYETEEDRERREKSALSKAKAAHIIETDDWAVDGEGG